MKKKYKDWQLVVDFPDDCICNKQYKIILITSFKKKNIPSFHVVDSKTYGLKFDSRISLLEPKYVKGSNNKLTRKQLMCLIRWLKKPEYFENIKGKNRYWQLQHLFNLGNVFQIDELKDEFDYSNLKTEN